MIEPTPVPTERARTFRRVRGRRHRVRAVHHRAVHVDPAAVHIDGGEHSLVVIAERCGLPATVTGRLVAQLVGWHLLDRIGDGRYRAGLPIRLNGGPDGGSPRQGVLADLAAATTERPRLGVLHDTGVSYIEKQPGTPSGEPFTAAGSLPAQGTALGQVLLALTGSPRDSATTRHLPGLSTVTSGGEHGRALALARLSRVTVTRSGVTGGFALAIPVRGSGGHAEVPGQSGPSGLS